MGKVVTVVRKHVSLGTGAVEMMVYRQLNAARAWLLIQTVERSMREQTH